MQVSLSETIAFGNPRSRARPPTSAGQNDAVVWSKANTTRNAAENGNPVTSQNTGRTCPRPTGTLMPGCHQSVCASSPGS